MKGVATIIGVGVLITAVIAGIVALEGLIIWVLWNALVPSLFAGPSITYVQGVLVGVALSVFGSIFGRREGGLATQAVQPRRLRPGP